MSRRRYIPDRGDLVWLDFQPQAGHQQTGRRPAVVLSPMVYNKPTHLAVVCPITKKAKGYPFEVSLPEDSAVAGVVLADQLKSLDWRARKAELAGELDPETMDEVNNKALSLLLPGQD